MKAPIPVTAKKFPTLHGSLGLEGPRGMCFHRAVALVMDSPALRLAIGVVRAATKEEKERIGPMASSVPFIHAWAETPTAVLPPSMIEAYKGNVPVFAKQAYYAVNGIDPASIRYLSRARILALAAEHGWRDHLTKHWPTTVSFGSTLLDAAGIAWAATPEGGVVPA